MPAQDVSLTVEVDGTEYPSDRVDHVTDRHDTCAESEMDLVTTDDASAISTIDSTTKLYINEELVFTGRPSNVENNGPLSLRVTAYDAIYDLKRMTFRDITSEDAERISDVPVAEIAEQEQPGSDVAEVRRFDDMPRTIVADRILSQTGYEYNIETVDNRPIEVSSSTQNVWDVLMERVVKPTDSVIYVDEENVVHITDDPPSKIYKLGQSNGVLETTAGKQTPAYQSVVVYGTSPVSEKGREASHMFPSTPVIGAAGEGFPRYWTNNDAIKTDNEAQQVANFLLKEFQKQQAGGNVTIVGDPLIRPLDVIEMPDHMGSEQYLVSGVNNLCDTDEGYRTIVYCGGLIEESAPGTQSQAEAATEAVDELVTTVARVI
jgi:hypothetical protein